MRNRVIPQRPPLRCGIWRRCPSGRAGRLERPSCAQRPPALSPSKFLCLRSSHWPRPVASSAQTRCPGSRSDPQQRASRSTMRKPQPPACMTPVSRRCGASPDNPGSCTEIDTPPRTRTARIWIVSAGEPPECTTALVTSSLATRTASSRAAPRSVIWRNAARTMAGAPQPHPTCSTNSACSDEGERATRSDSDPSGPSAELGP